MRSLCLFQQFRKLTPALFLIAKIEMTENDSSEGVPIGEEVRNTTWDPLRISPEQRQLHYVQKEL
jgi:hypothetical protein